ncbi:hypothetical protein ANT2_1955 [plant metagenome]|uniref:Uncharacterized protein n=1 Tax=plant metagenome TaxID=1297885 RepID=A0A484SAC4_9ZZZZ
MGATGLAEPGREGHVCWHERRMKESGILRGVCCSGVAASCSPVSRTGFPPFLTDCCRMRHLCVISGA